MITKKTLTHNTPRFLCWKCGLASGEEDLAGCTMDILADHEYVDPRSRPYEGWEFEELTSRYGRARTKAKSALRTASHLERCPAAGPDDWATRLYRQKAIKRLRVSDLLWQEIARRIDGIAREVQEEVEGL